MIVLTTPTGTIGGTVADTLRSTGAPLRLIARDPSRLPQALAEHAEVIAGSHSDAAVLDTALSGADALFVMIPPNFRAPDATRHYLDFACPIADAVRAHGVARLVAVSSLGRGYAGPAGLLSCAWAMDDVLESSGAAYRSLQPPFFMENLLHQAGPIRDHGVFAMPGDPDTPLAAVATGDIAGIAAELLADPTWTGRQDVPVRAPADHTPTEMAQIMSEVLGRPVSCRPVSFADYHAQYLQHGASPAIADAMVEMARAQAAGVYPPVAAGGTGTTFRHWCATVLAPALSGTNAPAAPAPA